ncbi:MAG: SurA N-terminal domain-containing protein [Myxococcota bacterium]
MMDFMRRNSNSWLTMAIFAVLIFVFAMSFGPWMGSRQVNKAYVATVNGAPIPVSHLQIAYRSRLQAMQRYNADAASDEKKIARIKKQALEGLVDQELLAQWAMRNGLVVSNRHLAEVIRKQFSRDGEPFDRQLYKRIVQGVYQTTEGQFESLMEREVLSSAMQQLLSNNLPLSDGDLRLSFELRNNKAAVDVVQLQTEFFAPNKPPSKQQLQAFVDKSAQQIEQHYNNNINRYQQPKKVQASHILFKVPAGTSAQDKQKIQQKAAGVLQQLKTQMSDQTPEQQKELFGSFAKKHSEGPTASKQGDLGFFEHSDMVKPFADTAFAMAANDLSELVETVFGYHIIWVQQVKEAQATPLNEVRDSIATTLWRQQQAQQAAKAHGNKLLASVKKGTKPQKLKAKGLLLPKGSNAKADNAPKVIITDLFTQGSQNVPKLGNVPEVVQAAFTLTEKSPVYDQLLQSGDSYYVLQLRQREKPQEKDFEAQKKTLRMSSEWILRAEWIDNHMKALREKADIVYVL